ncbi:MAG: hypothetical protein CMF38_02780 [Legionellaceae bacterium]|nr:hypothetical protein [Legionellaceae bacterium]
MINLSQAQTLYTLITFSMYLRLKLHFKYQEQKMAIEVDDKDYVVLQSKRQKLHHLYDFFRKRILLEETWQLCEEARLNKQAIGCTFF